MAKKNQYQQIPIRLRTDLRDWLKKRAEKNRCSMASLIRTYLDAEMKHDYPTMKPDYPLSSSTKHSNIVGVWLEERHLEYMNRLCAVGWSSRVRFISALIAKERDRVRQQ